VSAEEAHRIGLANEVVPAGEHLTRALEWAERLAAFPQETMLADRRAAIEGIGLTFEEGIELERRIGGAMSLIGAQGAQRFAGGEGRGGKGVFPA
jgi:enoyl-CoA hydratase